jgi:sulfur-oxidizing protein SoxZ
MAKTRIRIKAPKSAKKGEIIQIKTLVSHKMESGQRKDKKGQVIPRKIINKFVAKFNGKDVFVSDWHPAIAANPYLAFHMRATESGTLEASWTDDDGTVYRKAAEIKVN